MFENMNYENLLFKKHGNWRHFKRFFSRRGKSHAVLRKEPLSCYGLATLKCRQAGAIGSVAADDNTTFDNICFISETWIFERP